MKIPTRSPHIRINNSSLRAISKATKAFEKESSLKPEKDQVAKAILHQIVSEYRHKFSDLLISKLAPQLLELTSSYNNDLFRLFKKIFQNEPSIFSIKDIGEIYEATLLISYKKSGSVFTPSWLTESCSSIIDGNNYLKILDPTCGGGAFLKSAAKRLRESSQITGEDIAKQLYGIDRDPIAVEITRLTLFEQLSGLTKDQNTLILTLLKNIIYGDSLIDREEVKKISPLIADSYLSIQESFPEVTESGGFDVILGNPPYGLSRDGQIDREELDLIISYYKNLARGKPNKYILFTWRAYQLLKFGGRLAFVIPNSWLGIDDARALRELLITTRSLDLVEILDRNTFSQGVEAVTLYLTKTSEEAKSKRKRFAIKNQNRATIYEIEFDQVLQDSNFRFDTPPQNALSPKIKEMQRHRITLGSKESPVIPMIALQAYATGKGTPPQSLKMVKDKVFHSNTRDDQFSLPYLSPGDLSRYSVTSPSSYISYGPWLAEHQPIERYSGPRILVREITGTHPHIVLASYYEEPAVYNRSILHLVPQKNTNKEILLCILGILNSESISEWISNFGRKTARGLFPKVLCSDLKEIPLPNNLLKNFSPLAALVSERLITRDSHIIPSLEKKINEQVEVLYKE